MDFRRTQRSKDAEVDLTPLIDIIFILLIFFLLTASFDQTNEQSVEVDLPESSAQGDVEAGEELTVFIQADGTVSLSEGDNSLGANLSIEALAERLKILRGQSNGRPIFIRGDESVRYGEVVRVLDACRDAGFRKVFNVIRGQQ